MMSSITPLNTVPRQVRPLQPPSLSNEQSLSVANTYVAPTVQRNHTPLPQATGKKMNLAAWLSQAIGPIDTQNDDKKAFLDGVTMAFSQLFTKRNLLYAAASYGITFAVKEFVPKALPHNKQLAAMISIGVPIAATFPLIGVYGLEIIRTLSSIKHLTSADNKAKKQGLQDLGQALGLSFVTLAFERTLFKHGINKQLLQSLMKTAT